MLIWACTSLWQSSFKFNPLFKKVNSIPFKHYVADGREQIVIFLPVQKQPDGHNYGPFAIVYTAETFDGRSPLEAVFDVNKISEHLITCLEMQRITPSPNVSSQ